MTADTPTPDRMTWHQFMKRYLPRRYAQEINTTNHGAPLPKEAALSDDY